ncbi:MAG: GAF domain-containing protein, partial [Actinobacteria bacterium]|nr:GAF domain-containing protein [Actinomycetota bacterium]
AASRAARLQSVTATLTQAATREAVAEAALRAGIAAVGAAAGGVGVLTDRGRGIERLAMIGYPEALTAATRLVPLDDMGPIASTARTGEVIWLGTNDELFARYPHLAALPARRQFGATVSVPLMVEGRVIGVMSLRFAEERPLDVELRDLIVAIAGQCAQALERARLFEAEQDARTEAEYLAERLRLAQAAGRIGTFVWDIDADTVAWTPELEALYGLHGRTGGTVSLQGETFVPRSPSRSLRRGVALVPADRARQSVFADLPAIDNMLLPHLAAIGSPLWRSRRGETRTFTRTAEAMRLAPPVARAPARKPAEAGGRALAGLAARDRPPSPGRADPRNRHRRAGGSLRAGPWIRGHQLARRPLHLLRP